MTTEDAARAGLIALQKAHDDCKADRRANETDLWSALNKLRDRVDEVMMKRLPLWATALIAVQSGAIGWLMSALFGTDG